MKVNRFLFIVQLISIFFVYSAVSAQIGTRFPSEKKIVTDPVTGVKLTFLTSTPAGDSKIYQTHNQWTSDGEWLIFRSRRVKGEAIAVNEKSGDLVQVTEGGYTGRLNIARKSMKLFFMRNSQKNENSREIIEVNLAKLFSDSKSGSLKTEDEYQKICGTVPANIEAHGDMALDSDEKWIYFSVGRDESMKHLPEGVKLEEDFGPRNMGAGPGGIACMNIQSGEIKHVVSVPFKVGHIQTNPWVPGQIIFCWETGGKSPQRTWIVNSDGTGLRPLYPESEYEWVTHEAVISPDEVAFAIMGHREIPGMTGDAAEATGVHGVNPGQEAEWGPSGTREKPTGLGIVNINTREMIIAGQIPYGSGLWHVTGSPDGRFAAGDNFAREIYLIDRKSNEMILLSAGHKPTARNHPHPTFSPDGTKIQIQSAMLSEDGRSMNICIIPVPDDWLK